MSRLTDLEYALLCLLARKPRSGYDLLTTLKSWPFGGRRRSPGAVYPALARLEEQRLIRGRTEGHENRPRTVYRLSSKGKRALDDWMSAPLGEEEMLQNPDLLLLRFSFLPRLKGADATQRFLSEYGARARALRDELRAYLEAAREDAAPHSRLAMELSEALLTARAEWAERAARELEAFTPAISS